MPESQTQARRLRYYGSSDYATYFQVERAAQILEAFDANRTDYDINDTVEFHHAAKYVENDFFPNGTSDDAKAAARARLPEVRRVVGTFFSQIGPSNIAGKVVNIDHQFHNDVLDLLGRNRVFERNSAAVVLPVLLAAPLHISVLLSCSALVRAYDREVRDLLLASPQHAEQLIAERLQANARRSLTLPRSLTAQDKKQLIQAYIDSDNPNPNYLKLVANARVDRAAGIDAVLKLNAQRAYDAYWAQHFETNEGIKTGVEVRIVDDQEEALAATLDGLVIKYSYSRQWLTENLDNPTILNNFIYLFEFAVAHMLLNFPSFYRQLGVFERYMVTAGKDDYRTGASFMQQQQASLLQTVMYDQFLRSHHVELESVLEWFFTGYLPQEFGAENLRFRPASPTATYLERSRHLFSEMESVLKQFSLYVDNGELDLELLAMTSEQLVYHDIPSLIDSGKYVYATEHADMQRIQHLLFSDQAVMGYVDDELNEDTLAELLREHDVHYETFEEHQRSELDFLITRGILVNVEGAPLSFASPTQFAVLKCLNDFEAASYFHFSPDAQASIGDMEMKGWVERDNTLLTRAESSYFNYMLNQSEFSNGPDLRNRYLHGSQADGDDDRVHFQTYMEALRLLVVLVIKINDDFALRLPEGLES